MTNPVLHSLPSPPTQLTVAISGSTGLIGSGVVRVLEQRGHVVRRLVRRPAQTDTEIAWDPETETIDATRLAGVDAVINLAGESLATDARKSSPSVLDSSSVSSPRGP